MQRVMNKAIIIRRATLLLAGLACAILFTHIIVPAATFAAQAPERIERIATVAHHDSRDLLGLLVLCATIGVLVLIDRRRRSRVRQSSN